MAGRAIRSGDYEAMFLPNRGMLCASLKFRGIELLREIENLDAAAAKGSTAGIPLMHPWANRLAGMTYRVAGKDVSIDAKSGMVHVDGNGLPIHGVPWAKLEWSTTVATPSSISAELEWFKPEMLAVFPFPHKLEMRSALNEGGLLIEVTLTAGANSAVPLSFGFHPYFGLKGAARDSWRLVMPRMERLSLDRQLIPTGDRTEFPAFDGPLAGQSFDDSFAIEGEGAKFAIEGGGLRLEVEFESGYPYAQIYAPPGKEFIAIEPMTAPTNALVSGDGLQLIQPGESFRATFRVRAETA